MNDNLVQRLRERSQNLWTTERELRDNALAKEAANCIETLQQELNDRKFNIQYQRLSEVTDKLVHASISFAESVRQESNKMYPWPALDDAIQSYVDLRKQTLPSVYLYASIYLYRLHSEKQQNNSAERTPRDCF